MIGFRGQLSATFVVLLALSGVSALASDPAAAELRTFEPVKSMPSAVVFAPRHPSFADVRKAKLTVRAGGRSYERKVSAAAVGRAVRRGSRVRLRRISGTRSKGRATALRVKFSKRAPSTPPPSTSTSCQLGTFSSTNMPGACWRPYSSASPFNKQLPAAPRTRSNSTQIVQRWAGFSSTKQTFEGGRADTTDDYDHPIYYSTASDPIFTVHCTEAWGTCAPEGMQVRIPDAARAAGGTDGHLAVIDQASGWEYDFWQVQSKPAGGGTLRVSWGGRTQIGGDGLGSNATSAHFGLAAGLVRPSELATGKINHALFMIVQCSDGTSVYPAASGTTGRACSQMGLSNADAPPLGTHFYLDMTDSEINGLAEPQWKKAVLLAMAHYGLIVGDTGGGFVRLESGSSYTSFGLSDPWVDLGKQTGVSTWPSGGKLRYIFDLRSTVDWKSRLKVVDPCVDLGTC